MGFFNTHHKNFVFIPSINPAVTVDIRKTTAANNLCCHRTHRKATNTPANPINTLTHVMHLFEEKNKYPPAPVGSPLPIKANGAIVVHRPNQQAASVRSLPLYLQSDESEEEEEEGVVDYIYIPKKQSAIQHQKSENQDNGDDNDDEDEYHTSSEFSVSNNTTSELDANTPNIAHLVHEENHRLRQQILLEREQNEQYRLAKERFEQDLMLAQQCIKRLQRTADRFQRIVSPASAAITAGSNQTTSRKLRRLSTGDCFCDTAMPTNSKTTAIIIAYEHKLQILLNEIEAMEQEEIETIKRLETQANERNKLVRKLKFKDEIIRQLAYDLQYQKSLVH